MSHRITTGIDIGTYQIKVVVAEQLNSKDRGLPKILGTGFAQSKGLRHGYIINSSDVIRGVRRAVGQAEKTSGMRIKRAFISLGGVGLDEIKTSGETIISRGDLEVTDLDVDKALKNSEDKIAQRLVNKKVLHTVPLEFHIDGEMVLGQPQGMRGSKLSVDVLFVTCLEQHLKDLIQATEEAGVIVEDVMASPFAASLVTLTKAQKMAGCILANIGSETVSIVVFENGVPISLKVLPIGAKDVTNDIALGLKISLEEAEQIKLGAITGTDYPRKRLDQIIAARLSDIFELIEAHLKKIGKNGLLPAGIIITGGGSGIATIEDLARASLKLPSKVSLPALGRHPKIKDASWAVSYGLAVWGLSADQEPPMGVRIARTTSNSIFDWIKRFLP